jgi:hypothetical protein
MRRTPPRRLLFHLFLAAGFIGADARAAEHEPDAAEAAPRWRLEPRGGLEANVTLGDARRVIHQTLGLTAGVAVGRDGSPLRWRAGVGLAPFTDVGPGASLALVRAEVGVERAWRPHVLTAFELGGVVRRLSIADELTRSVPGVEGAVELGWCFFPGARWSATASLRYSGAWFVRDLFYWQELGVSITVARHRPRTTC